MTELRRIPCSSHVPGAITGAARWGLIASTTMIAAGVFILVSSFIQFSAQLSSLLRAGMLWVPIGFFAITIAVQIVLNLWLYRAAIAFRKAGRSAQPDREAFVGGFRQLRTYLRLQCVIVCLPVAWVVTVLIIKLI